MDHYLFISIVKSLLFIFFYCKNFWLNSKSHPLPPGFSNLTWVKKGLGSWFVLTLNLTITVGAWVSKSAGTKLIEFKSSRPEVISSRRHLVTKILDKSSLFFQWRDDYIPDPKAQFEIKAILQEQLKALTSAHSANSTPKMSIYVAHPYNIDI